MSYIDLDFVKEISDMFNKPKNKSEECMQNLKKLNELLKNKK